MVLLSVSKTLFSGKLVREHSESLQNSVSLYTSILRCMQSETKYELVGFEAFTAVVMKFSIFWDKTSCSSLPGMREKGSVS
jgi:hypothetical protein